MNKATQTSLALILGFATSSTVFGADGHGPFRFLRPRPPALRAEPIAVETAPPPRTPVEPYVRPDLLSTPANQNTDKEWKPLVQGTLDSLNAEIQQHFDAIEKTGIGTMYGPISEYGKLKTDAERQAWIEANKKPGAYIKKMPARTSCVDFVLTQLRAGYEKAGKLDRFNEIKRRVVAHAGQGAVLLQELEKDGWTIVYWNPDVKNPSTAVRTETDIQGNHRPSHHPWTASLVKKEGLYLKGVSLMDETERAKLQARFPDIAINPKFAGVPAKPENSVLNFRPTNPSTTTTNEAGLKKLYDAPLFVGIANGGYHVYAGSQGRVVESHSSRNPSDPQNLEVRDFNSWGMRAPDEGFGSGAIAVPPGAWGK